MIEIKIPSEITSYKEKLAFGLTARQILSSTLALAINVPLYIYGKGIVGDELMSWIIMFTTLPIGFIGFFNYNGMNFEQFLVVMLQTELIYPRKRLYQTENLYENILKEDLKIEKDKEKRKNKKSKKDKKNKKEKGEEVFAEI